LREQGKKAVYDLCPQLGKFCLINAGLPGVTSMRNLTPHWTCATVSVMIALKFAGGICDALG
jgi:hypothetical protein